VPDTETCVLKGISPSTQVHVMNWIPEIAATIVSCPLLKQQVSDW
jgi:hypothetical protein